MVRVHFRSFLLGLAFGLAPCLLPAQAGVGPETTMELDGVPLSLSRDELAAVTDLADRLRSPRAVQDRALAVARQKAHGRDARYVLALYELEIARQRKDDALRAEALDALIASGLVSGERLAADLEERGGIAFQQHDYARAGALWSRELQLKPNDANLLSNLAQVRQAQGDAAGAADLLQRSAASRAASGRKPTEILARQMLSTAYNAHLLKPTADAALALVAAYPSADNWRLSLLAYRQLGAPAGEFEIDLLRLMRATFSLTRPEEYQRLAQLLEHSGRPTEGRAVLEEGISRQLLDPGQPTIRDILAELDRFIPQERARLAKPNLVMQTLAAADSLGAFGRHAEAIALYRGLLAKPGIDAAQVNVHLGTALLAAGRQAEAESRFRSAAADPGAGQPAHYADLAAFWIARLTPPSPALAAVRR
jgi:tetratricopeptide (TPR) repeat protein